MNIIREFLGTDLYKIVLHCQNCGKFQDAYIRKGTSVEDYMRIPEHRRCPNCSCFALEKARIQ